MQDKRFQIGDFWLSRRSGSQNYYATTFNSGTRQTDRRSLGTDNLQEAQILLAKFVIENSTPQNEAPAVMPLATVLLRYWNEHGSKIPSSVQANIALGLWTEFWGEATVAELPIRRQEEFVQSLRERGYKNSYISRVLSVGRAAINRAWKRGEITSAPFIMNVSDRSDKKQPYRLNKTEMQRFLRKVQDWPHVFVFSMIMLNTLSRPEAALDLSPAQVRLDDQHIHLNPKGRKQTKKYRPIVPITDTLLPFVSATDVERFVLWNGKPIKSVKKTFALAVKAAGLPKEITPYSLRHTMAMELRKAGVPAWEVEGLLGHRRPGVTETYAEFSPDYLSKGREAIDDYFKGLGVAYKVPDLGCVTGACQRPKMEKSAAADLSTLSRDRMVGVTGIEPVTPTMST
ncbi:site-specific integrase [Rhizobium bangladeshense]|nr:site-specific integrase [Rhizobium bangladeshense]